MPMRNWFCNSSPTALTTPVGEVVDVVRLAQPVDKPEVVVDRGDDVVDRDVLDHEVRRGSP